MFGISQCLFLANLFSLVCVGKTKSLPFTVIFSFRCTPWVGSSLSHKLESHVSDKHSSLLRKLVNYGRKKFHNIGPRSADSNFQQTLPRCRCQFAVAAFCRQSNAQSSFQIRQRRRGNDVFNDVFLSDTTHYNDTGIKALSATFSITTLNITTLNIMTLNIMTLNITTLNIMTLILYRSRKAECRLNKQFQNMLCCRYFKVSKVV